MLDEYLETDTEFIKKRLLCAIEIVASKGSEKEAIKAARIAISQVEAEVFKKCR